MTIIKIQNTTVVEYDTSTGKSRVSQHYSKVLGTGSNAKKRIKKTVKADVAQEEFL